MFAFAVLIKSCPIVFPVSAILVFSCPCSLVLIKSCPGAVFFVFFACSTVTCPLPATLMLLTRWNNNISIIHFANKGKQQYIGTESRRGNIELYETLMETCKVFKVFDFDLDYFPISSAAGEWSDLLLYMINVVTITITHAPSSLLCQNEDDFGFKYIYTFLIFTKGPVTKFNVKAAAPCQSVKCVLRFCMSCVLKKCIS